MTSEIAASAFFGVGVWEHFHDKPITGYTFLIGAVLLFWAGAFVAWLKKHGENKCLTAALDDRRPKLQLSIDSVYYEYHPDDDLTAFVISAYLLNAGEPSVALSWSALYRVGESVEPMTGFYIRDQMILRMGNETLTLTNANHLQAKVLTTRLERGAAAAGRLVFTVLGDRTAQVKTCQFSIEVTCHDFQKTPTTAAFRPDPKPLDGIKMYPGELLQKGATQPEAAAFVQPSLPEQWT